MATAARMNRQDLERLAVEAEKKYGIPSGVLRGVIEQESGWNPSARNPSGAIGLTQIVPKWHPTVNAARILQDPAYAIDEGAKILSARIKSRKGDVAKALADYNWGQGNVAKWEAGQAVMPAETVNYVPEVLGRAKKYGANISDVQIQQAANTYQPQYSPASVSTGRNEQAEVRRVDNIIDQLLGNSPVATPATSPAPVQTQSVQPQQFDINQILARIDQTQAETAAAQTGVDTVTIQQKTELAQQAKDIQRLFGLDPATTDGEILATAQALRTAQGELVGMTQQMQRDMQNPLFAIGDMVTGGRISAMHQMRIASSQKQVESLTTALGQLHAAATKQMAIGQAGSYALAEQEIQARARLNTAKANEEAAKLGIREVVANERRAIQQQQFEQRQEMAQMRAEIMEKNKSLDLAIKEIARQTKSDEKESERGLFGPTAKAMGFDNVDEYISLAKKDSFLRQNFVGESGELTVPMARKRIQLGKATKAQEESFRAATNPTGGWASPVSQANIDNPMWVSKDQIEEYNKSIGTQKQSEVILNMQQTIAAAKRRNIINDGSPEYTSANPYAANFWALQAANMPEMKKAIPALERTLQSTLYTTIAKKNEGNSSDKMNVGDEEVIRTAQELVSSKVLTVDQAGKELSDYFRSAAGVNNATKQFKEIGFPEQDGYQVPVKDKSGKTGFIGITPPRPGKGGQMVRTYRTFDLTNETNAKMVIMKNIASTPPSLLEHLFPWTDRRLLNPTGQN